jgi:hypothetical protein
MSRLLLTLAAWLIFLSVGSASLAPRKEAPVFANGVAPALAPKLTTDTLEQAAGTGSRSEYAMTERTEVVLNGKPCKYADVPAHARIVKMDVAADKKTVLRIYFRTAK